MRARPERCRPEPDRANVTRILERVEPVEVYYVAAQLHVKVSFEEPEYTADIVAVGTLRMLDSVADYIARTRNGVRFYQAGLRVVRRKSTPAGRKHAVYPRNPYAASKLAADWFTVNYREALALFACKPG